MKLGVALSSNDGSNSSKRRLVGCGMLRNARDGILWACCALPPAERSALPSLAQAFDVLAEIAAEQPKPRRQRHHGGGVRGRRRKAREDAEERDQATWPGRPWRRSDTELAAPPPASWIQRLQAEAPDADLNSKVRGYLANCVSLAGASAAASAELTAAGPTHNTCEIGERSVCRLSEGDITGEV
jgi:hypothetical protein